MRKLIISRTAYKKAVAGNKKINANLRHVPMYTRPQYVAMIGKTEVLIWHMQPGEYDPRGRPLVPLRNIQNTRQKTLAINPGYRPEIRVALVWID